MNKYKYLAFITVIFFTFGGLMFLFLSSKNASATDDAAHQPAGLWRVGPSGCTASLEWTINSDPAVIDYQMVHYHFSDGSNTWQRNFGPLSASTNSYSFSDLSDDIAASTDDSLTFWIGTYYNDGHSRVYGNMEQRTFSNCDTGGTCGDGTVDSGEACDFGSQNDSFTKYRGGNSSTCGFDRQEVCNAGCGCHRTRSGTTPSGCGSTLTNCDAADDCTCDGTTRTDGYMRTDGACVSDSLAACGGDTPTPTPTDNPTPTNTPVPTNTPTPTPVPEYSLSGTVFYDLDGDGTQEGDCFGACNNGSGDEPGASGVRVEINNGMPDDTTNTYGSYAFSNITADTTVTVNVHPNDIPDGYDVVPSSHSIFMNSDKTDVEFAFQEKPPECTDNLDALPGNLQPGETSALDLESCENVEDPDTGDPGPPPPYDWDPPQDDNADNEGDPQCDDGLDNDGDELIDADDPGCHWDGDSGNPDSYDQNDDFEGNTDPGGDDPQCSDGIDNDGDGLTDYPDDPSCDSDLDDNESDRVSDGHSGSVSCQDGQITNVVMNSTSTTADWTAPICPTSDLTGVNACTITAIAHNDAGNDSSSTTIDVPRAGQIDFEIYDVSDSSVDCASVTSSDLYTEDVTVNLNGDPDDPDLENINTTETVSDGNYVFACLPNGNYTVSINVPDGYNMSDPSVPSISTSIANNTQTARFCIVDFDPWFQTDRGDVRMTGIVNPVPGGEFGSTDSNYPGVFHSTQFGAQYDGDGSVSNRGWTVNNEYNYNDFSANRNGTVAYSFYEARARQEGVDSTNLTNNPLDDAEITGSGIFEYNGDLTIDSYTHEAGQRVVLMVNGDVTINTEISVAPGGLFILAAKGNITVSDTVGHAEGSFSSTESNLDGYYSAEGDIVLEGDDCDTIASPDRRLNVAGALIANAQKPFTTGGAGQIVNNRSLCGGDNDYPSLYVETRPDFLTELTDFYKTSYRKWREVRP